MMDRYVPVMYKNILVQVTLTHHFNSGTISLATLTSLLPSLSDDLRAASFSVCTDVPFRKGAKCGTRLRKKFRNWYVLGTYH